MLDTQQEFNVEAFKKLKYQDTTLERKLFYDCDFDSCVFQEVRFVGCRFYNCSFKDCDLSLSSVNDCLFSETAFMKSTLVGINWAQISQATLIQKPFAFEQCILNYSTFIGLNLPKLHMVECVARDVDFAEVNLTDANLSKTDFAESHFRQTNLTRADFTDARNYTINPSSNTLTQAKFALPEALSLLRNMDILLSE